MNFFNFSRAGIERIENSQSIYLTFDDGPSPTGTPEVLECLEKFKIKATFFIVAKNIKREKALFDKIISQGHAIGNHSLDHTYGYFFSKRIKLKNWINEAEDIIAQSLGHASVGFRPPAGVVTPQLIESLAELNLPLILWKHRFYDSQREWRSSHAIKSLNSTTAGDILLLHDSQKSSRVPTFTNTLRFYISAALSRGYTFDKLPMIQSRN